MLITLLSKRLLKIRQRRPIHFLTEFQHELSRSVMCYLSASLSPFSRQLNQCHQSVIKSSSTAIFQKVNILSEQHRISKSNISVINAKVDSTNSIVTGTSSQLKHFFGTKTGGQNMDSVIGQIFINETKLNILHNKEDNYFYILLTDLGSKENEMAKLQYEWIKPGLADLFHTEVPSEFQGQGIAKQLVLAGLDAMCKDNVIIRPSCTYVRKVMRESQVQQHLDHTEKGFIL